MLWADTDARRAARPVPPARGRRPLRPRRARRPAGRPALRRLGPVRDRRGRDRRRRGGAPRGARRTRTPRSPASATCRRSCPASRGKVEFDDADEGREFEVLEHLLRRAIVETYRSRLAGLDLRPLQERFDERPHRHHRRRRPAQELLTSSARCRCCRRCSTASSPTASARVPPRSASRRPCSSSPSRACT